ncbi:hypothetical protein RND71_037942 [Anisodus tanguticus]|uniref:Uncharacterized protein n=1 Tax=Anisodus tanguticus TaxID=243964 RepID=A0AAE1QZ42_9SOLA|nr:hypothetical protein RND71_037942 [Anisodus tanguticus]
MARYVTMCFIALIILFAPSFEARKLLNNMKNENTDHSHEANLLENTLHFPPRNNEVPATLVSKKNQFAPEGHVGRNLGSVPSPGIGH